MKKPTPLVRNGGKSAAELFSLVGQALSWWEAAEDSLMGLFRALCGDLEPVAMEAFVQAPRKVRESMALLAMNTYAYRFVGTEVADVQASLKEMNKLASRRNEIAHGFVVEYHGRDGNTVVAEGHYLLPSRNETGPMVREPRFHHTPETLRQFITDIRRENGKIQDVYFAVMTRGQDFAQQPEFNDWGTALMDVSRRLGRQELNAADALRLLRLIMSRVDEQTAASSL
jgi:hypothetical protein